MESPISKYLYIGFVLLGMYYLLFNKDYFEAASSLGIALVFDPFNTDQKWNERPTWQKSALILHLILLVAMFTLGMMAAY